MKKYLFLTLPLLINMAFGQGARPKVGIISIYANKQLETTEFTGMAAAITQLANSEDFNLKPIIDSIHTKVFGEYIKSLEYDFLPEQTVLSAKGYNNTLLDGALIDRTNWSVRPDGYVAIGANNKDAIRKTYDVIPGMDAVMILSVDYDLVKTGIEVMGFGTAKIQSRVVLKILDKDGKKLFKAATTQRSEKNVKFALGGAFKTSEILPLCKDATAKAFKELDGIIIKKQSKD